MQHLLFFSTIIPLFIEFHPTLTTPLTTINKGVLVNITDFTIEINTINHFINNRVNLKRLIL